MCSYFQFAHVKEKKKKDKIPMKTYMSGHSYVKAALRSTVRLAIFYNEAKRESNVFCKTRIDIASHWLPRRPSPRQHRFDIIGGGIVASQAGRQSVIHPRHGSFGYVASH